MLQETNQNERAMRIKASYVFIESLARLTYQVFELLLFLLLLTDTSNNLLFGNENDAALL